MYHHDYVSLDEKLVANEKRILLVVILTFVTMILEIVYGHLSGSMALLADGWHMGSHVAALGLSWLVYRLARSKKFANSFSFGTGKMIPLGGYTSALMLGAIAIFMIIESVTRFLNPQSINFKTAIIVAVIGLVVNFISAVILWDRHDHDHGHGHDHHHGHDHDHAHDHNHQSALIHVIADALTSVLAIIALVLGNYFDLIWCDPLMGVVGAIVILKWGYGLSKTTAGELLDIPSKLITGKDIAELFTDQKDFKILDFHYWRIAPKAHACEIILKNSSYRGSLFYRERIQEKFTIEHLVIEEQIENS